MSNAVEKKEGLVLSGGGAYGAFGVGTMKALFAGESPGTGYAPLDPIVLTGTSIGAFNAAYVVSQAGQPCLSTIEELEQVWLTQLAHTPESCGNGVYRIRGNPVTYLDPRCFVKNPAKPLTEVAADSAFFSQYFLKRGINFFTSQTPVAERAVEFVDISSFFSIAPFRQLVSSLIPLEGLSNSAADLRIAATNWKTGQLRLFRNDESADKVTHEAILASTALPGVFPPVEIEGDLYVDGGVAMNTPLLPAIRAGATTIHVIYLVPAPTDVIIEQLPNTLDTIYRQQIIEWDIKTNEDIETVEWINKGLEIIERAARGELLSDEHLRDFLRVAGVIEERLRQGKPYKILTVHNYRPWHETGEALKLLNFKRESLSELIERGYQEAIKHDCVASKCILPVHDCDQSQCVIPGRPGKIPKECRELVRTAQATVNKQKGLA